MIGKEILNYKIISLIGSGGMGSVYLAEHKLITEQKVAIKVINANMVNDYTRDMLKKEAKRLALLKHQNIVRFQDYHIDKDGNVYLVMEYAEGKSLEDYLKNINGLIVEDRICPIFEPILDAVGYAHKKGILHRDIKPANIVIGTDGQPKILDFGIAQIIKKNGEEAEEDNLIMGTPSYMSPEQVKGEHLDERSDIYSLGVLLHQMLTGNPPYDTTTLTEQEINTKVVEEKLPRMKTYYKYVSDKVQGIVDKATAKDPKDRYQSTDDFKKALHKAIYPWKPQTWMKIAAVLVGVFIIGGGFWIWDYNRVKTSYFKDYTEQWGVPVGIGKLKTNAHSNRAYKFVSQKGKLLRVSHVNSLDNLIDDGESERNERPVDQEFYYTEDGKIHRIKVKDRSGKVLYVKNFNDKLNTMSFQYDDEHGTERTLSNSTVGYTRSLDDQETNRGRISKWWLDYDENGYVTTLKYAGLDNSPVGDENGIYGRVYVRDEKGRPTEIHYIGIDGQPQPTKWGLGIKTFSYDDKDNWIESKYMTIDRNPALDAADGTAVYSMEYDDYGNETKILLKDFDGNLMYPKMWNFSGIKRTYDDRGFNILSQYLDIEEKPMICKNDGSSSFKYEFDDNGYCSTAEYFGLDGQPIETIQGFHRVSVLNDKHGNQIERWAYSIDGNLVNANNEDHNCGYKVEYDSVGNIIKEIICDKDQQPMLNRSNFAGRLLEYNDKNLVISMTYLGKDLEPTKEINDICVIKYDYDKRGNMIQERYYEADGITPSLSSFGNAVYKCSYDDFGNRIEESFYGLNGELITAQHRGFAKCKFTYDENNNLKALRYYNPEGKLALVDGCVGKDFTCDSRGNIIMQRELGLDGKLVTGKLEVRCKYDEYGNQTEVAVFDVNGKPALNNNGVHKETRKYNNLNLLIETRYYDVNGNPTLDRSLKCAGSMLEYDSKGNETKGTFIGVDGKPCLNHNGWSMTTLEHDIYGNLTKACFFDANGKPVGTKEWPPVAIYEYDKWGHQIYIAAQNENGEFITFPNEKHSIRRNEYDAFDNIISESFYNDKDEPILGSHGYHKTVVEYDLRGRQTSQSYYNTDEKPMAIYNIHKEVYKYDDNHGQVSELALYDTKEKPVNCDAGWHKTIFGYNNEGTVQTTRKYYKADGTLIGSQEWDGSQWITKRNWKAIVEEEMIPYLPQDMGPDAFNLTVQNMKITGNNSCEIVMTIPYSQSELPSDAIDQIKLFVDNMAEGMEAEFNNEVYVTCTLYDKNDKVIYSVRK